MRRAFGALALTALALAVFASAQPSEDAHAATTCTKHTKRVVKDVKRHGKRKRVVRLRPYWTCHEVAEPVAAILVPAPTPAPETPAPQPQQPAPTVEPGQTPDDDQ